MTEDKPFCISKWAVLSAWAKVRDNNGAAGVDGVSVEAFGRKWKNHLYRVWNRMSSGSYMPPPVRRVMIPKADGRQRPLGIPTVADRVAQMVVKMELEPTVEPLFHPDSFGNRPGKPALDAVGLCRQRCWLKAPVEAEDGSLLARDRGTPQGGVISPLLANIFLHHVFDQRMGRAHPGCPFERYADDVVIHCQSYEQALAVKASAEARLRQCRLAAHPDKTRIVYCRDSDRPPQDGHPHVQFDFLGYSFRPRAAKSRRTGRLFTSFLPAISAKAQTAINATVRDWHLHRRSQRELADLSRLFNPTVRGWVNYYGRYYPTALWRAFRCLNQRLVRWAQGKYKRFRASPRQAAHWLRCLARRQPALFAHWQRGIVP